MNKLQRGLISMKIRKEVSKLDLETLYLLKIELPKIIQAKEKGLKDNGNNKNR